MMNINKIIERVKNILLSPAKEWDVIKGESATIADLFTKYAIFLAAIPAIAGLLGFTVIGYSMGILGTFHLPLGNALMWAVFYYIFSLAGVGLLGFLVDTLAPSFGATKDMIASMKTAVYANTAAWVAGIFFLIPGIRVLVFIGGLYSLYLLYIALQKVKGSPQDKVVVYLVVLLIIDVVVMYLVNWLAQSIAFGSSAMRLM